jgi:hypothetical protein
LFGSSRKKRGKTNTLGVGWLTGWLAVFFDDKLTNRKRKQEERKEGRHEERRARGEWREDRCG